MNDPNRKGCSYSEKPNSSDTISRQAAIGAICTEGTRLERNGTVAMAEIKQWCVDILEALPSAQPEITVDRYADGFADGYKQGQKDAQLEIIYCKDCKHWTKTCGDNQ